VESGVSAKEDTQLLEMEREGEADALQQKIAQLPGKASKLINMHYFEGNTISEVSRKTGEKVGTIKSSMTRGRQTLKKILERENAGR
jgi:RNA polymerase sigma-70 factor (ECF subfamily)